MDRLGRYTPTMLLKGVPEHLLKEQWVKDAIGHLHRLVRVERAMRHHKSDALWEKQRGKVFGGPTNPPKKGK